MAQQQSIFEQAGFTLPKRGGEDILDRKPPAKTVSLFEQAGFTLPTGGGSQAAAPDTSWKDTEAQANLAAQGGYSPPSPPPPPPTGWIPSLAQVRGYAASIPGKIAAIPEGIANTFAYPGQVYNSTQPTTSEQMIPGAVNLAGVLELGGRGASAGATAAVEKLGPQAQAVNQLVKAIGPENVPAAVERMQANPRLTVADVSDTARTLTQGLIDPAQPKAQNAISAAVARRQASAPDWVNSAYTSSMGPAPDVVRVVDALKQRAREAGRQAIQPALEGAKAVDVSPVIAAIDAKLKPGINALAESGLPLSDLQQELARVKQSLVSENGEQLFDAQRLHRVQSDLGDQAFQLSKSPNPKDRMLGSQLRDINEKLIDQIDTAAGGAYRPARQKFADAKDISEAFESGFDTLKNRQGLTGALEDSPQALSDWISKATPEEIVARQLGTRADIEQKIKTARNQALAGQNITKIEYNRAKLQKLFGNDEADRLIRTMEDSSAESATNAKLVAGAKTAETQAGQRALQVPQVGGGNPLQYVAPIGAELIGQGAGLPGVGFAASLAARGVQFGVQYARKQNALARNAEFAKAALATGPERNILMERLLAHPQVQRLRIGVSPTRTGNALTAP